MKTTIMKALVVAITLSYISACSNDEPSEAEISQILQNQMDEEIARSQGIIKEGDIALNSVNKIECLEAEASSDYNCDIELDLKTPYVESKKSIYSVRLVKSDEGWTIPDEPILKKS